MERLQGLLFQCTKHMLVKKRRQDGPMASEDDGPCLLRRGSTRMAPSCLSPQLVPSKTSSERNFALCSPSLEATAPIGPRNPSQVAASSTILFTVTMTPARLRTNRAILLEEETSKRGGSI